jgi:hypothetical protein
MTNQLSISDLTNQLTNQMKQLAQSGGGKELQLSETAAQMYINEIQVYRQSLHDQLQKIAGLADYGHPGNFPSALQTRKNLIADTNEAGAILKKYIDYLDEFENAVKNACGKIQAADQSG